MRAHRSIAQRVLNLRREGILGVLAVGPYPPPYGGIASGLRDLGVIFGPLGFQLHVLAFTAGSHVRHNPDPGVTVTRADAHSSAAHLRAMVRRPFRTIRALGFLIRTARSSRRRAISAFLRAARVAAEADEAGVSIVSIYGTSDGSIVPFLRRFRPRLQIIYWIYAGPFVEPQIYRTNRTLYVAAVKEAHLLAATSKYCAGAVAVIDATKTASVVYIGVDLERFRPGIDPAQLKSRLGLGTQKIVMFLGRMEPEMGAANALSIAQELVSRRDDVTFLICGATGSLTREITNAAEASDRRIMALVDVSHDDLPQMYAAADVVIAPTGGAHACMGVSVKEAMASGKPTVVSDSGGLPEAVQDGVHGYVVPLSSSGQNDDTGFVVRIDEMIDNPDLLIAMGAAARIRAQAVFSREDSAGGLLKLISMSTEAGNASD